MALPSSSCIAGEQKRDFDLSIVLESLKKATKFDSTESLQVESAKSAHSSSQDNHSVPTTSQSESLDSDIQTVTEGTGVLRLTDDVSSQSDQSSSSGQAVTVLNVEDYLTAFTELTR